MEIRSAAGANASALATGFQFIYAGARLIAVSDGEGEGAEIMAAQAPDAARAHDTLVSEAALNESVHAMAWDVQQRVAPLVSALHDARGAGASMTALMFTDASLAVVQLGITRAYLLRDSMM